jgi:hypothetical protein
VRRTANRTNDTLGRVLFGIPALIIDFVIHLMVLRTIDYRLEIGLMRGDGQ